MIQFRAVRPSDYPIIREKIHCACGDDTEGIVAYRKTGEVVAIFLGDSWTDNSVQVHQFVDDPIAFRYGLHYEFAEWVFGTCGRKQMLATVPATNEKALRLNRHYGFREIFRIPEAYKDGEDLVVMRMYAEECKYYHPRSAA